MAGSIMKDMTTEEMARELAKQGFLILDLRDGLPEVVTYASKRAVRETGLIGTIDRMFAILKEEQDLVWREDEMARE